MEPARIFMTAVEKTLQRYREHQWRLQDNLYARSLLRDRGSTTRLTPDEAARVKGLWRQAGFRGSMDWHRLFKDVNGFDVRYVPLDLYTTALLPRLRSLRLSEAWKEKTDFSRFFPDVPMPRMVGCRIEGLFYDGSYRQVSAEWLAGAIVEAGRVIVKPSNGSQGYGVELWEAAGLGGEGLLKRLEDFGRNYVVQEVLRQHEVLARFNPSSVNPVRIITFRLKGKVRVLNAMIRWGLPGVVTDLTHVDGKTILFVCGLNRDGVFSPEYFDTTLERFPLANLGISEPLVLPNYDRMVELALSVHERLHHFDIVGFDIALGQDKKPVMIEYNIAHPSIDSIQFCWGPLFGEDTEEILRTIMTQPVR